MDKPQTLKESYEYAVPPEDIDGIKRVATSGMRKLLTVAAVLFAGLFVLLILLDSHAIAYSSLTAGIISVLLFATTIRNTNRAFDKTKNVRYELSYKIRVYDDFIVFEKSGDAGLLMLNTSSLYDAVSLGENEKYAVISTGVYAIPIPKDILAENSFFKYLHSLKGAKLPKPMGVPELFVEPRDEMSDVAVSNEPIEEAAPKATAEAEETTAEATPQFDTPTDEKDMSEGADCFRSGSFEAYGSSGAESSSPYLYESFITESKNKRLKIFGTVTFVLSLLSIFAAIIATIVSVLNESSPTVPLLLISLLPVSSLVVGVLLFTKREKYLKNIFAAILALVVIISVDPTDVTPYDTEMDAAGQAYAESIEAELGIDIPEIKGIYYYDSDEESYVELSADISPEELASFIESAKADGRFIFNIPNPYMGILPEYYRDNDSTVTLIYNRTTDEYNTIPEQAGSYRMLYVSIQEYDGVTAFLRVIEYDLEYVTEFENAPS